MVHFQTKNHLLMWLEKNCPRNSLLRIMEDGTVEHLGGFSKIPPTSHPGWVVKLESRHGKIVLVAIIAYRDRYGIRILSEIPWRYWCGDRNGNRNLINGDSPYLYGAWKEELKNDT